MLRGTVVWLGLLSNAVHCFTIAEIDVKSGVTFSYFSPYGYQKRVPFVPTDIAAGFALFKMIACEAGIAYNCRTVYSDIDKMATGPNNTFVPAGKAQFELRHDYLSAYLLPGYSLDFFSSRIYLNAGLSLDFYITTFENQFGRKSTARNAGNNTVVIGLNECLGYKLNISKFFIGIENHYLQNITKVIKSESGGFKYRNVAIKGILGYKF